MARYELRTFSDIITAVMEEVKIQSADTTSKNRIKRNINTIYLNEVIPFKNWSWTRGSANLQSKAYFSTGTASVTSNSVSVTLTNAPSTARKGYYFAVVGYNEVYRISSHTAGSTTVKLEVPFTGSTNATASFRIWSDAIALPTDAKEVLEVSHQFLTSPVMNMGLQEFRRIQATNMKVEGRPSYYTTTDFKDPDPYSAISGLPASATRSSSGLVKTIKFASSLGSTEAAAYIRSGDRIRITGAGDYSYNIDAIVSSLSTTTNTNDTITFTGIELLQESSTADTGITVTLLNTESYERYRELLIHPAVFNTNTTLSVDYIRNVQPLENDADEPVIPVEDRIVLYYGALWLTWGRERNPEEAATAYQLFQNKLSRMAGKTEDSPDKPRFEPSKLYMGAKRASTRYRSIGSKSADGGWGGGSAGNVSGTANMAAVFDSTGTLVASTTISTTELGYLDGATSNIQTQLDAITTLADGKILVGNASNVATEVTPSGDVTITNAGVTAIGSGVIVNADVNASAAIDRTKIASGTAYRILANTSAGVMSENAALTASEAVIGDANGQLSSTAGVLLSVSSVTLTDNTATPADVVTFPTASYDSVVLFYTISRGASNKETGTIYLATDGSSGAIAQAGATIGSSGVTFSADVSGGNLRLRYITTNTGTNATFKYRLLKSIA